MTFKELLIRYNPITGKNQLNEILDLTEQNFGIFSRDMELDIRSLIKNSEVVEYFDRIIHEEHPKLEYDKEQKKSSSTKAEKRAKMKKIAANKASVDIYHSAPNQTNASQVKKRINIVYRAKDRKNNGKYVKQNYDDFPIYVDKIKGYLEEEYRNTEIFISDIDMAINRFQLRDNPECWKIKEQIKRYADEHNSNMYISSIRRDSVETALEEIVFSWDDIAFHNGYITISDKAQVQKYKYVIDTSKEAYNAIRKYFIIKFEDLEIRIINGNMVFNDEGRFVKLLSSIESNRLSSYVPDLELTPKGTLLTYFSKLPKDDVKKYILLLKHKYLSYLCVKHKDKYRIHYLIEKRVNFDNDAMENAFIFTVSETNSRIVLVYENTEDDRSSIVFYVRPNEYNLAVESIRGYFSSWEYNKREKLATYDVTFKNSGIIKLQRIYHSDYDQWKKTINSISY